MKLIFRGGPDLPDGTFLANAHKAQARHGVILDDVPKHDGRLAVVGGGPSVSLHLDEIATFDQVWGINATWRYLRSKGIPASLYSIDAAPALIPMAQGAPSAVLASRCDPGVWEVLDCVPTVFHAFQDGPNGVQGGSSSATCALSAATNLGFRTVKLFGCDSSFADTTHIDRHEDRALLMRVRCNGVDYLTAPDFYTQAKELALLCKMFPSHLTQSGDGLLGAMVENDDHDVTHFNKALADKLSLEPA